MELCQACRSPLTAVYENFPWHPNCAPEHEPIPGMHGMSFYDLAIKEDLIDIIRWSYLNSSRSQQVALGCSEVGHPCDRRLAYKIAGIPEVNIRTDPWPAVVGTSVHSWMEQAVNAYQQVHGQDEWITEMEVLPNPLVMGHTDLYGKKRRLVLDWKFPSPDNIRHMRENGPSVQYMTQVQLYGLGHLNAGRGVDRVGIIALGRQGWLKDLYVHTVPFDRSAADAALARIYALGHKLIDMNILEHPEMWADIDSTADRLCSYCPWYRQGLVTDDKGCPGI